MEMLITAMKCIFFSLRDCELLEGRGSVSVIYLLQCPGQNLIKMKRSNSSPGFIEHLISTRPCSKSLKYINFLDPYIILMTWLLLRTYAIDEETGAQRS